MRSSERLLPCVMLGVLAASTLLVSCGSRSSIRPGSRAEDREAPRAEPPRPAIAPVTSCAECAEDSSTPTATSSASAGAENVPVATERPPDASAEIAAPKPVHGYAAPSAAECSAARRSYARLRPRAKKHRGQWDRDLHAWGSELHESMSTLGRCYGDGKHTRPTVEQGLGRPDHIVKAGEPTWALAAMNRGFTQHADILLVYEWRGLHDFLFCEVRSSQVLRCDWWLAGE